MGVQEKMYIIKVDEDKCIGCGACVAICEEAFELKEGKAIPVRTETEELDCEREAAEGCPVEAISIEEE